MGISAALGSSALLPAGLGFRNLLINGDFRINQRAFSSTTSSGTYGFDRWTFLASGGTTTYSAQTFTLGNAISGQEPTNFARLVTASQSASGDYALLAQRVESVRTFAGQQVTLSFWAKASSGTPKVAVEFVQGFGTGGSPSSDVNTYVGQMTLSTSWVRYSVTVAVPSISGKTIGTGNNDSLSLFLWTSAGTTFNSRTSSLGVQNVTIDFWGVQLEQNYQPTPFEQRPYGVELQLCQRYYYRLTSPGATYSRFGVGFAYSTTQATSNIVFPTTMRSSPTALEQSGTASHYAVNSSAAGIIACSSVPAHNQANTQVATIVLAVASGLTAGNATECYANGTASAYLGWSAEL